MIKIIKAEEQHVEAIGQLWWEFIQFHADIDPVFAPVDDGIPGFIEHHLRKFMTSEDGLVLVAVDGETAIGYTIADIHRNSPGLKRKPHGCVYDIAVTASCRRQGIGKKLFAEVVKWFESKDISRYEINTTAQNETANSFWQKQGFKVYMYALYKEG